DGEPAQLRREAPARVDLHQRTDVEIPASIDGPDGAPVPDGISEDESVRPAVQEGDVERRGPLPVLDRGRPARAVLVDGEYDEAVGIRRIRSDDLESAVCLLDPEDW